LIDTGTPGLTLTSSAAGLIGNGTALTAIGLTQDPLVASSDTRESR
jgi:hypothetical protein